MHTCNCWHLCRKRIMQMLIARCWLGSFFCTMAEAGIPTTIFSSAEKQTARNYNLEFLHKFSAENYFGSYKRGMLLAICDQKIFLPIYHHWFVVIKINWIGCLRILWRPFGLRGLSLESLSKQSSLWAAIWSDAKFKICFLSFFAFFSRSKQTSMAIGSVVILYFLPQFVFQSNSGFYL